MVSLPPYLYSQPILTSHISPAGLCKSYSSSSCNILNPFLLYSSQALNCYLVSPLFSNAFNLCHSVTAGDHVLQPSREQTKCKLNILYALSSWSQLLLVRFVESTINASGKERERTRCRCAFVGTVAMWV
jgi:hypothetical protein